MRRNTAGIGLALVAFLLSVAVAAGGAPGAQDADSAPSARDLFLVPDTGAGAAAREAAGARTVARYEAFSLVSAPAGTAPTLRAAGADKRNDLRLVRTEAGNVDPRADRPPLASDAGGGLALVQFIGPVKDAWLADLSATGVDVITYMASDAYIVHGTAAELAAVANLAADEASAVRAATALTAADKVAAGTGSVGDGIAVETVAGAVGAGTRSALTRGGELRPPSRVGATVTVFVDGADPAALAADDAVVAVEPYVEPELLDERAAQIVAGNLSPAGTVPTGPGYLSFLNSSGFPLALFNFAIDVTDEGIDTGVLPPPGGAHTDFFVSGLGANATRVQYSQEFGTDPDARDCGGHGTNVASIAAGFNTATGATREDAQGFNYGMGIAPRALLGATKIFTCTGTFSPGVTFTTLVSNAHAGGARVSNNSWGANTGGAYNADAREYDMLVRDARPAVPGNQQMVELFAAGNAGSGGNTIGAPGTAKNVITVGAAENVRPVGFTDGCGVSDAGANSAKDIIDFSSRGPTDDGRIKPDVVAPGTHVTGAQPQVGGSYNGSGTCNPQFPAGNTLYSLVSGTSQATPEATGFAALIRDWYRRTHGGGTTVPSPALTKALMVNTATDIVGGDNGAGGTNSNVPTQIQGWGRINLGNVLAPTARDFVDQTERFGGTGQSRRFVFDVDDTGEPLKVTMAYSDAPGPLSGNTFVNDLDLVVHSGGQSFQGNVFSGGLSSTGGAADPRNNLENVFLPAGTGGRFSVEVIAKNIAGDGVPANSDATDQDFALVVSNANAATGPVLSHDLTTAAELALSDGDGFIEPGEKFSVSERLRNKGNAAASGISAVLSAAEPGITVPQPNATYADIAPAAARSNTPLFQARLLNSFPCGATADLELAVTTAQGPATIPISVQTGAAGPPAPFESTDVPKTIPDLTTVDSTRTIAASVGTITDIDVRIGSLTHTFDGDLVISLIGPGGSPSVILSDNRGSSGDNFTSTRFDDEAATAIAAGAAPFTGSFRPDQPLTAFDGLDASGTWTLRIQDQAGGDTGTLNSWGMDIASLGC